MSQTTKRALAESLKKLLAEKPLDRITVVDITEDCGVNRQTFYYHFQDLYDLIEWIFVAEAGKVAAGEDTYETWQQGLLHIFQTMLDNKPLIWNAYHSKSREQVERYLHEVSYRLVFNVVERQAASIPVRERDRQFITNFYKCALEGLLVDWIRTGMKDNPARITEQLGILVQGDIARGMERFRMDLVEAEA